jgi:p-hydroxybenzoate 3-monooxygenase
MTKTQVLIVGAGPSGLLLARLLARAGIQSVVLEARSRAYVEARIRAGVLEQGTVTLLEEAGVATRLHRVGLPHDGFNLAFDGRMHRIDNHELTGKRVFVYGQTEIQRDLAEAHVGDGGAIYYEADQVSIDNLQQATPRVSFVHRGETHEIECDFVAGCDGYHGVSRKSIPITERRHYERIYPFGWLGILVDEPPVAEELIYVNHQRGFALCSMRSKTRSRYYLQCAVDDKLEEWPDDRFWSELRVRLPAEQARKLVTGTSIDKSIAPLRSFVTEPMRYGRLFLVGDAAHIVPPTGAKGLNLAASDVNILHRALLAFYQSNSFAGLEAYSGAALARVWTATRFSWWFTSLMHRFSDDEFAHRLQVAELEYISRSESGSRSVAENYVGFDFN